MTSPRRCVVNGGTISAKGRGGHRSGDWPAPTGGDRVNITAITVTGPPPASWMILRRRGAAKSRQTAQDVAVSGTVDAAAEGEERFGPSRRSNNITVSAG